MIGHKPQVTSHKIALFSVFCLYILLCFPANATAEITTTEYLGYLQAEAFYLYSQGMLEDAISRWEKVLSLDRSNETALYYIEQAQAKIDARNKPKEQIIEERRGIVSMRQKLLGPTQGQFSHTKSSHNEIAPHFTLGENRYFDHSISIIRNSQGYAIRTKRETTSIAENIRANTDFGDYNSSFAASWLYEHSPRDDLRFPRYINYILESDNFRFTAGDSSTYLSRYVLNGMNYRGMNFTLNTDESIHPIGRLKVLYGFGKSFDTQSEEYFYPIEVFGIRNEAELSSNYKCGISFAYQVHEDQITRVDSSFRPKKNIVYSFDQFVKPMDWWTIRHEVAYSQLEDEIRRVTVEEELPDTSGWAHYITSNIMREKWQLYNVYEYGSENFISLAGEPRFFHNTVLNDRELFENTFIYTPINELLFELQYHRLKNNLDGEADKETTKENLFKGLVKFTPNNWMPSVGLKTSLLRARSTPGSDSKSDKEYTKDVGIEFQKTFYNMDWNCGYTYQKSAEDLNYKFCDVYRNIFSLGGSTAIIPDRTYLNTFYSFADLDILLSGGDMTDSAFENKTDLSLSSRLFGSSNIALGYHYFNRRDYAGAFEDLDSHTGSFVFNWPYTKELFGDQKFTVTPYLSYYYTKNDEYTDNDRGYFASRLDADYYLNPENKLGFMCEYKEGSDGSDQNQEGEELRLMATYTSSFGL